MIKSLQEHKENKTPHMTGEAHCITCHYQWIAVAPLETIWLECPKCKSHKAAFMNHVDVPKDVKVWTCKCENQLFFITEEGCWCPNCGSYQKFPHTS